MVLRKPALASSQAVASFYQTKGNLLFFLIEKQVRGVNGGEVFTLLYVVTASCADTD